MKRIIKDYDSMSEELRELVNQSFPDGVKRTDLMTFPTPAGKRISGVEIHSNDTIYIIKGDFTQAVQKRGVVLLKEGDDDLDAMVKEIPEDNTYDDLEE